jgi:hypothetical protein
MPDETASPPRIKISWIFWTLLAFAIFAVIASYSSRMTHDYTDYDQQRAAERYATLAKLRDADREALTTADWVDQNKGIVHIPIEEAMNLEVAALKTKPVAMGPPFIVPAAPAPATNAPAAMTHATPATNAAPSAPLTPAKETR